MGLALKRGYSSYIFLHQNIVIMFVYIYCDICPKGVYHKILSLRQYFPIHSLGSRKCIGKHSPRDIIPVASYYQEKNPYSAMNIGSVKINTSLVIATSYHTLALHFTY